MNAKFWCGVTNKILIKNPNKILMKMANYLFKFRFYNHVNKAQ